MKTEIYYFSGSGNSHYIAKTIASSLDDAKLIHIGKLNLEKDISSDAAIIGVIFPIYFYDAPDIIKKFLEKLSVDPAAYIFLYENFGGNGGNAIYNCQKILLSKGLKLSNYFSTKLPDNCTLFKQSKDKNQKLLIDSTKEISKAINHIKNFRTKLIPTRKIKYSIISNKKIKNTLISLSKLKELEVLDEKCTRCGLCEKVCPVSNIEFKTDLPSFKNNCQMCLACVHYCPSQSIRHKKIRNKNNYQYKNPYISMIEIINK
ncbi:MAG: EFR1 family ferrodoxin [Sarcina sp.]